MRKVILATACAVGVVVGVGGPAMAAPRTSAEMTCEKYRTGKLNDRAVASVEATAVQSGVTVLEWCEAQGY
jgi:hypothetical protein